MGLVSMRRLGGFTASAALHAAGILLLALLSKQVERVADQARGTGGGTTTGVTPVAPANRPADTALADEQQDAALDSGEGAVLRIPGFEFDIETIRARRNWLFPFVTTDLLFLERAGEETRAGGERSNSFASLRRASSKPALSIPDTALQSLVDRAWSRRERWRRFGEIAALLEKHDPQEGRSADVIHAYLDQNLLQPYHDTSIRDPRFWAMLSCVADHVEFIDWIRSFTREYPSSRATTELLFLLDELAQGSRDTLLMVLGTDPIRDMRNTRERSPAAYELAIVVRRQYADWLGDRQLLSPSAIRRRYDEVRLRILSTIVETTPGGYRAADAQFLAGEILFNRSELAAASRWWRDMHLDPRDSYVLAATEILRELRRPGGPNAAEINRILGAEHRRWLDFSRIRLQRFGYTFETF